MDNKKIIIIGALILIICIVAVTTITLTTVNYDRIEITPNGTSIEIPTNNMEYLGDTAGVKIWKWNYGALVTYNSQEGNNTTALVGSLGFNAIKEMVQAGTKEDVNGITIYRIDARELYNSLKIDVNGRFYCIDIVNETTHDNIIICSNDRDTVLHMAQSIEYKN